MSVFDPPLPDEAVGLRHRLAGGVVFVVSLPQQAPDVEDTNHRTSVLVPAQFNPSSAALRPTCDVGTCGVGIEATEGSLLVGLTLLGHGYGIESGIGDES